ncbi:hypothetical protein [Fimbriiglobus ruber]|uniref:Uncharacterized protein n=1 Tax=Fimbriiglobus ruber TaxID=1908690 RepID=A0A225E4J0_9BACT|nr:hypothetical protein [Fimbriiglobus ruber]OWK45718.1 hypothetical protein FRUB_02049 [Fimbriiglobus ruber]
MRDDVVYRIYARHDGREKDYYFGAFRSIAETEAEIAKLRAREMNGHNWAEQYHNRGFVIRKVVVETDFEIPLRPKPRDKYTVKDTPKANQPGAWASTIVEVFRRTDSPGGPEKVCEYERNYSLLQTFEPFRQGGKEFALVSRDYTRTAVLDLGTGSVIAEEIDAGGGGFCPAGFYVPDWWDLHDGSVIPGSEYWDADQEWPTGDFGFVWGCHWGDDGSWKVQYLDLSRVRQGVVRREERFGYVELAASGLANPCFTPDAGPPRASAPPRFITLARRGGVTRVTFAVEMQFDLGSGKPEEWQRLRIANME